MALTRNLRVFLKLPKAPHWLYYEFFYSDIDRALLLHENDMVQLLAERFPDLRVRHLRLGEWRHIRRLLGHPRRCSAAFFAEERALLERRRGLIRLVQQRRYEELRSLDGLPEQVPPALVIGTRVTGKRDL